MTVSTSRVTTIGRPTKCSPELTARVAKVIQAGNFREVAAEHVGITPTTLSRWMVRDREPYRTFRQAVLAAEKSSEVVLVGRQQKFAMKDARANQWLLERRFPERWARHDRLDMTLKRASLQCLSDDELTTYLQLQEKVEAAQ